MNKSRRIVWGVVLLACLPAWAQELPSDLEAAYLRGEYAKVIESATRQTGADRQNQDYLWYWVGMSNLQIQQYAEAQEAFQKVVTDHPQSSWRAAAEIGAADAIWMSGSPIDAVTLYQQIITNHATAPSVVLRATHQLAGAARASGQWEVARSALQSIVEKFPASFEARMARQTLASSDFAFSIQVGAFGIKDNALRLQRQLARLGYSASVDQTTAEGRAMHRVRVGHYQNRDEAVEKAQQLKHEGFPAKVVP